MVSVQSQLFKLALNVDPQTEDGQQVQDVSAAVTITGAANNGSGLIRITAASHNFITNNRVYVSAVTGTTEANSTPSNPNWLVTRISSTQFDLQGSAFANAYVSGGRAIGALIGSVDGSKADRFRLLAYYNQARILLADAIGRNLPKREREWATSGNIVTDTMITFASGTATKPTGYISPKLLTDVSGNFIPILPSSDIDIVKSLESATNRFVFDMGTQLKTISADTFVTNGDNYVLRYFGVKDFVLTDVTNELIMETYNLQFTPKLVEMATMIASQAGLGDVMAVANAFIKEIKTT
jgi:hypothetical protein